MIPFLTASQCGIPCRS